MVKLRFSKPLTRVRPPLLLLYSLCFINLWMGLFLVWVVKYYIMIVDLSFLICDTGVVVWYFIILVGLWSRLYWFIMIIVSDYLLKTAASGILLKKLVLFSIFHLLTIAIFFIVMVFIAVFFCSSLFLRKRILVLLRIISSCLVGWGIVWNFCFSFEYDLWLYVDVFENYSLWIFCIILLSSHYFNKSKLYYFTFVCLVFLWMSPVTITTITSNSFVIHVFGASNWIDLIVLFLLLSLVLVSFTSYRVAFRIYSFFGVREIFQGGWINFCVAFLAMSWVSWYGIIEVYHLPMVVLGLYFIFWSLFIWFDNNFFIFYSFLGIMIFNIILYDSLMFSGALIAWSFYIGNIGYFNKHVFLLFWMLGFFIQFTPDIGGFTFNDGDSRGLSWLISVFYYSLR